MRIGPGAAWRDFDVAVVGGGINGCGIAREAAGRGFSVFLSERDDLASGTSSASTKLIHGGLRYLEQYEFRLVRESLSEREILWRMAPHIIRPLRFVLPHHAGLRPSWLLRLGLFLYDHLAGRTRLPGTRSLDLRTDQAGGPLKAGYRFGLEYSDCWVEDARLVVLTAMDAAAHGAVVRSRTPCVAAARDGDAWAVTVEDAGTGVRSQIRARVLVNAAGPWVDRVLASVEGARSSARIRLVQGSHIAVPRLYEHDRCYVFQNADRRVIFAIPFERDFTLIGTTERDYHGDPAAAAASQEEIAYLCGAANEYFRAQITPADVVWTYSGVRPLYDDGTPDARAVTRDYVLELDAPRDGPALLSVLGGKITTFRVLARSAVDKIARYLPAPPAPSPPWSRDAPLPGGDFRVDGFAALVDGLASAHPGLAPCLLHRLARSYGTRAAMILAGARTTADLGHCFGADLTEREVRYLMAHEWARTADDIVWRRSKLGLRMAPEDIARLDTWMKAARLEGAPA
jgi:glycerol-3-phosphate dehydrogenase